MNEDKYVPQVGDIVVDRERSGLVGVYVGQDTKGGHLALVESEEWVDSKRVRKSQRTVFGKVEVPYNKLDLALSKSGYGYRTDDETQQAARLLADMCWIVEAESGFMSDELRTWWTLVRCRMAQVGFVDAWIKTRGLRDDVRVIEQRGGTPGSKTLEQLADAEHVIDTWRSRVLKVYAEEIAEARKQHGLDPL